MKLYDYDFREYERKFVIVSKTGNLLKELKKKPFITEDNESIDSDIKIALYNEEDYIKIKDYSEITWKYTYEENEEGRFRRDIISLY